MNFQIPCRCCVQPQSEAGQPMLQYYCIVFIHTVCGRFFYRICFLLFEEANKWIRLKNISNITVLSMNTTKNYGLNIISLWGFNGNGVFEVACFDNLCLCKLLSKYANFCTRLSKNHKQITEKTVKWLSLIFPVLLKTNF